MTVCGTQLMDVLEDGPKLDTIARHQTHRAFDWCQMRTDQADREPVSPALSDRGPFRAGFVRQVGAASANRSRGDREEGR